MKHSLKQMTMFCALLLAGSLAYGQQPQHDWANLKRYRAENDSIRTLPVPDGRVVFMGNSITEGWKSTRPAFFATHPYIGRGISGQTTPQMLVRFRQDVIALKPKAVVILAGTNDIAGNTGASTLEMILDNIASMAELAVQNGIQPILCSVLPAYDYPWRGGQEPHIRIPVLNQMIKAYAQAHGYPYVDYFGAMADDRNGMKTEYTYDGVHCTAAGYELMERMIVPVINEVVKKGKAQSRQPKVK